MTRSQTGAVLLVVLVVGGYVMWRMRRNMAGRRGGLSELRPPGPSPSTTLALTDVQAGARGPAGEGMMAHCCLYILQ